MNHHRIALQWIAHINIFSILSIIISILAFSIGFYAFGKIKKTRSSFLLLCLCITIGIWVFASSFIFIADPETSVWFWYYFQSFGFVPMWPILIHFFVSIAELDSTKGKRIRIGTYQLYLNGMTAFIAAQYAVAIVLHSAILLGYAEPRLYEMTPLGLRDTPAMHRPWVQFFTFMNLLWYAEGITLVTLFWIRAHRKNSSLDRRKQSEVITITGIVFGGITLTLNIILPMFGLPIPAFGSIFIGIWILCIAYAVSKYNFGAQDEQVIGQKAFDITDEPMAVSDTELNLLFFNRAFINSFGDPKAMGKLRIYDLFEPSDKKLVPADFRTDGIIPSLRIINPAGQKRVINLQTSCIYSENLLDRIFFVFSDVTEIAHQKEMLEYLVAERTAEINRQLAITEKYTRPSLVQVIQSGGDPTDFVPSSDELVIMFIDIRDFTLMSEKLSSSDTVKLLNSYFTCMNECIIKEHGEIDKLIGDAIMALFSNADNAVHAAINMIYKLQFFNESQKIVNSTIRNGIGINFGHVTRGNIGSKEKLDYTVIGDSVNAASRFESLTKRYGLPVVLSEEVISQLKHCYKIRFLDKVVVKGREQATSLYEVFDFNPSNLIDIKIRNQNELDQAFEAYTKGDFEAALNIYRPLNERYGTLDPLLGFYERRSLELLALQKLGKLERWSGIYQFTDK